MNPPAVWGQAPVIPPVPEPKPEPKPEISYVELRELILNLADLLYDRRWACTGLRDELKRVAERGFTREYNRELKQAQLPVYQRAVKG